MSTTEELAAREALILGYPQRMQPVERNAESEAIAMDLWRRMRFAITGDDSDPGPAENIPGIHFTMMRHPQLWEKISGLAIQLSAHGTISPRERELVILRTGWLCRAPFEWGEHVKFAKQLGISSEEIERITTGSEARGWNAHESAVLLAVEELYDDAMLSDETWLALRRTYSEEQCFELTVLVGQFMTTAFWLNSLRIPLNEGISGLEAR
jgi:alkylhydroperoxidase family enzyme